ncbi:MAG: nucleotide exchange factor GrpE [Cytophagaceae bacterium]
MNEEKLNEEEVAANSTEQASEETAKADGNEGFDDLTRAKMEAADWKDKYVRLYAEFENFRKRSMKEKSDLILTAGEDIIKNLLPVVDDFERALNNIPVTEENKALREGVDLIYQKYLRTLQQKGLKEMQAQGEVFNPDVHEAITQIPAPSEDLKGKVVDVVEKGYYMGDKVVRYAKVVIGA